MVELVVLTRVIMIEYFCSLVLYLIIDGIKVEVLLVDVLCDYFELLVDISRFI